jgi:hypothetical protein
MKKSGLSIYDFQKAIDKQDSKPTLRDSEYPQFDWKYAQNIKDNYPEIWKKGGNIRGNDAYNHWTKARQGEYSQATQDWIREREAWMARHKNNHRIAGVIAIMKWGGVCSKGEKYMKNLINEYKQKLNKS